MKKNIIIALSILVIGFVIGLICRRTEYVETTIVQRDTTFVRDTLTIAKPAAVTKVRKGIIPVFVTDTIRMKDTLYVALPMETKIYKGDEYYAEVSGYRPSLDVIQVYPKTVYVTEVQKQTVRQRNYLSAGVDAVYLGSAYVPIYLEYERMLHRNFSIHVRGMRDLLSGTNGVIVGAEAQIGW